MMFYEGISGKAFGCEKTLTSTMVTHYSCLLAANPTFMSFAEFVDSVQDREVLEMLAEALEAEMLVWNAQNEALSAGAGGDDDVKKKKRAKA
jgi:hypothetical protein